MCMFGVGKGERKRKAPAIVVPQNGSESPSLQVEHCQNPSVWQVVVVLSYEL